MSSDIRRSTNACELPVGAASTIQHFLLLQSKVLSAQRRLKALNDTRRETVDVLSDLISKESWTFDQAAHLVCLLDEHGVIAKWKNVIMEGTGWTEHSIRLERAFQRAKSNPRGAQLLDGIECVYALMESGKVVHVGRTRRLSHRLRVHSTNGNTFDDFEAYPCREANEAADLEAILQQQHRPVRNKRIEGRRLP